MVNATETEGLVQQAAASSVASLFAHAGAHPSRSPGTGGGRPQAKLSRRRSARRRAGALAPAVTTWGRATGSRSCRRTASSILSCSSRRRGSARSSPARTGAWRRRSWRTASAWSSRRQSWSRRAMPTPRGGVGRDLDHVDLRRRLRGALATRPRCEWRAGRARSRRRRCSSSTRAARPACPRAP